MSRQEELNCLARYFLVSVLTLSRFPYVTSLNPSLYGVADSYVVMNGKDVRHYTRDDRAKIWKPKASLDRLDLLHNDVLYNVPRESCILAESEFVGQNEQRENTSHYFHEVHKKIGINHIHRDHMAARPHCVLDFVVPVHNSSKVIRLKGEFCIPEHLTGGAAVGDYNNDGFEDIFFTVFSGRSVLYRNNGDGTFIDVTTNVGLGPSRYANGAGWVDVDQDGDLDLYVTTVGDVRHYLYINYGARFVEEAEIRNCSLQFPNKRKLSGFTPNFGDFDNDGFIDIYVTEWILHNLGKPSASRLLRNKGIVAPGYFEDVTNSADVNMDKYDGDSKINTGTHTFGSSFTDFNDDGWPELLVTADYGDSKLFWNRGDKTFRECTWDCGLRGEQDAMGHAIGDWNNDGVLDWFSSAIFHNETECSVSGCTFGSGGNRLFRNLGNKSFDDVTDLAGVRSGRWGWGAAFIDFNNDGYQDFIMTNGIDFPSSTVDDHFQQDPMRLWQNLGPGFKGKTKEVSGMMGLNHTTQGRGLLKFDYDGDGDEDVIVCNNVGAPDLFQNQGGNTNDWLKVKVVHRCVRSGERLCDSYGARVQVTSESGHLQTQEIGSDTHYLGQSEITAHFGLGLNSKNVTLLVRWPARNMKVTYIQVPPNTKLRIVRPEHFYESGKIYEFSLLNKCSSLKITAITRQPYKAKVAINPDGRTVSFTRDPKFEVRKMNYQRFEYRVSLVPPPGGKPVNSTAEVHINYLFNDTDDPGDECGNKGSQPVTSDRRYDGISNNMKHPFWGAAGKDLPRDLPAAYGDGIAAPAGVCTTSQRRNGACRYPNALNGFGSNRPPPREISNVLFTQAVPRISSRRLSDMHAHFGQFLTHDLDFSSPLPRFEFQGHMNDVWLPIQVPKGDVHFDPRNMGGQYLPFLRTTYNRCTGRRAKTPRQQFNKITSYIDGSVVYGETEERLRNLRSFKDGKMRLDGNNLLPKNTMGIATDNVVGRMPERLMIAGDSRVNVQPGLIVLHTLFVREHNRLCDAFLGTHANASDEEVFQYARRMVAAELQAITFREYLPSLLGGRKFLTEYSGYNNQSNAGISNIMATAAFRYGHSQVGNALWRLDEDGSVSKYGHLPLRDAYFAPERVEREGGIDPILRGAATQAAQEVDLQMVDDMRNVLFPVGRHNGLDLAAMNIQRGRDHGLPDYNTVRKAVGLPALTKFSDISEDKLVTQEMERLYSNVDNIDLWVGGLAEDHEEGSELGPTFRKILTKNFLRVRDGDRFWYERFLSEEDIELVNSLTLGRIIRLNTDYKSAPDNVFFSSMYCNGSRDHQCISRDYLNSHVCTTRVSAMMEKYAKLKRQNEVLERKNQLCPSNATDLVTQKVEGASGAIETNTSSIFAVLGVISGLSCLLAALFLFLWCREKRLRNGVEKEPDIHLSFSNPQTTDTV